MALEKHEEAFVRAFIRRERRQRYLYLLESPKQRSRIRDRLVDLVRDLDPRFMEPVPAQHSFADIASHLQARGAGDTCHVISYDKGIDGVVIPLAEAIEDTSFGAGAILSCRPGTLAYCVGECGFNQFFLERGKPRG